MRFTLRNGFRNLFMHGVCPMSHWDLHAKPGHQNGLLLDPNLLYNTIGHYYLKVGGQYRVRHGNDSNTTFRHLLSDFIFLHNPSSHNEFLFCYCQIIYSSVSVFWKTVHRDHLVFDQPICYVLPLPQSHFVVLVLWK